MKKHLFFLASFTISSLLFSQINKIPLDTTVITKHSIQINGKPIAYEATAGMQPIWNTNGEPIATLFYTYYKKSNSSQEKRPIIFSFNGGPGSASAWMHIAYTGPVVLNIDKYGYPVLAFCVTDNANAILDVSDIILVDPVNTGYSRMVENKDG